MWSLTQGKTLIYQQSQAAFKLIQALKVIGNYAVRHVWTRGVGHALRILRTGQHLSK